MIETPRLVITKFSEQHLTQRYVSWLNDPEVVRYSDQRFATHSLDSCREYFNSFRGTPHWFFAIVARDALGHIGNVTAYIDTHHSVADVGILIGLKACWGRGYGTEAFRAVCDYLLGKVGVRKVTAGTLATNTGMLRIMQQVGMKPDGARRRQALLDGIEVDVVHGAIFGEDWAGAPQTDENRP